MADETVDFQSSTLATPPNTTKVAVDLVGGVAYQRVKLDLGADGALAPVAGTLPVSDGAGSLTVDSPDIGLAADAAVITDVAGTLSGKLRGLVKWAYERMPASLGQKTKAASFPIVLASDQDALPITDNAGSLTVDAPVATPLWVRESDGAAAYVGQKTMALSKPVVIASDQSAIPVSDGAGSLTVDAPVGTPVNARLSDGAANYDAAKTGQLPAALAGGRLDTSLGALGLGVVVPVNDNAGSLTVDAPVAVPVFTRLSDGAAALIGQKAMAASLPVTLASDQSVLPASAEMRGSSLWVTGTAAVNTGVTVTLPAAGAGLFHYITSIQIDKLYNVIGIAAGAGVIITTTNLPGNPAWTTEQLASPAGTVVRVVNLFATTPLKSSVANTATTIVCPVQLQTIWRVNVTYFTAV